MARFKAIDGMPDMYGHSSLSMAEMRTINVDKLRESINSFEVEHYNVHLILSFSTNEDYTFEYKIST